MSKRVIVIGSGIIGASIAWHLAREGAAVSIVEAATPGGVATRASWAWINASWGNPEPYFRLRIRSMTEWRRLETEIAGLSVNWCGGLMWDLQPDESEAYAAQRAAWGHPVRRVSRAEILAREPNLKAVPESALLADNEGMIEPLAATEALLAAAKQKGAEIIAGCAIKWLAEEDGKVVGVMTDEGVIHAEETIIAAGTATPELLDTIGIALRIDAPPGLLSHSQPVRKLLNGLVMTPGLHVRQTAEGRLVAGTDFTGADPGGRPQELAAELHGKVQALVAGAEEAELDFHTVGYRPAPADGFPAIGRPRQREGLYVAVSHSGVTLAPALGLFAAEEILTGRRDLLLSPYHPDRAALT